MLLQSKSAADAAVRKITEGTKEISGGKEGAVKDAVCAALVDFCRQSEEFADAVNATGKTMKECIKEIMHGVGNSISDVELYRRAVQFWLEGADVEAQLRVVLPNVKTPDVREKRKSTVQILSLEELL